MMSARFGIETRHAHPAGGGPRREQRLHDGRQLVTGEPEVVHRLQGPVRRSGAHHLGQVDDGAGAAHRDLESVAVDGAAHLGQVGPHVLTTLDDLPLADRLLAEEPLGQADVAELEAVGVEHPVALADHELGGAAADVDHEHAMPGDRDRLEHAEVNEPGLLDPRDHLHVDPGLVGHPTEELSPVLGLPDGARGHGPHRGAERGRRFDGTG